jgi:hypothetical protein
VVGLNGESLLSADQLPSPDKACANRLRCVQCSAVTAGNWQPRRMIKLCTSRGETHGKMFE